jgi:phosphohistidine phosphatase
MQLYIIRHADAVDADEDELRPLSVRGREEIQRLARFLKGNRSLEVGEIWHSPLVRARQTARLLAAGLGWRAPMSEVAELQPESDPGDVLGKLKKTEQSVAIFGHEPHLSALASLLLTGDRRPVVALRKGAVLALERRAGGEPGCWVLCWHISPELLGM